MDSVRLSNATAASLRTAPCTTRTRFRTRSFRRDALAPTNCLSARPCPYASLRVSRSRYCSWQCRFRKAVDLPKTPPRVDHRHDHDPHDHQQAPVVVEKLTHRNLTCPQPHRLPPVLRHASTRRQM